MLTLREMSDRMEIQDLLVRYAHAVDTRDWPLFRELFTADAVGLIRELTPRGVASTEARPNRGARMVLLAPLKRLTRSLFGGRK